MGVQNDPVQLRPLSIGEIFDRAITLLVRNWVPFAIVGALCVLPSHICEYLSQVVNPIWGIGFIVFMLLMPAATMATAKLVAALYGHEPLDWRGSFVYGLSRIPSAIGINFTFALIALLPLLVVVGIPSGMGAFTFSSIAGDLAAVVAIVLGGAIFVAMAFAGVYALNAVAIGDYRAMDGVGRALELFKTPTLGRTMLFALAQVVVAVGGSFAGGFVFGFFTALHSAALGVAVNTLIVFIASVLGNVVTSVYYFDVAIRSEGYDLQVALDTMPST